MVEGWSGLAEGRQVDFGRMIFYLFATGAMQVVGQAYIHKFLCMFVSQPILFSDDTPYQSVD